MKSQRARAAKSTTEMSLLEHLADLRRRLIVSVLTVVVAAVVSFILYDGIIAVFYAPFQKLKTIDTEEVLWVNTLFEGFLTKFKVSLLAGLAFSLPVHVYNFVGFVLPGLTSRERRVVVVSLVASSILAVLSVYYGYATVLPISVAFLTSAGFIPENVGLLLSFGKNIFYVLRFLFVTLLLFQIPVLLEILMALNAVKRRTLFRASRMVVLLTFVVAALLTPPDFVSQLSLALPMIVLFFLTLLIAKIFGFGNAD